MNFWFGVGRLTKDPVKVECNEKILCKISLATNSNHTKDGERVAEYHNLVIWNKQAENCLKYLKKGSMIAVVGELQTRNWEDNGTKKYTTEIVVKELEFLVTPKNENKDDEIF